MKDKSLACLFHLAFSTLILSASFYLIYFIWHPSPLELSVGVNIIFLIASAVFVILGPVVTFIIFNKHKKHLTAELAITTSLQVMSLIYGLMIIEQGRPHWIVFNVDRFDVVRVADLDTSRNALVDSNYLRSSLLSGPKWVGSVQPNTELEKQELIFETLTYGIDQAQRPDLYVPIKKMQHIIASKALPLALLNDFNRQSDVLLTLSKHPTAASWLPLKGPLNSQVVLLESDNFTIVGIVPLNPWQQD